MHLIKITISFQNFFIELWKSQHIFPSLISESILSFFWILHGTSFLASDTWKPFSLAQILPSHESWRGMDNHKLVVTQNEQELSAQLLQLNWVDNSEFCLALGYLQNMCSPARPSHLKVLYPIFMGLVVFSSSLCTDRTEQIFESYWTQ